MPRWLTPTEQRAWRALLGMNRVLFEALDRQLQADAGLPHTYYTILAMLSEAPNRALRMSELAAVTNSSQSRVSHAIARLEESGRVRREPCPSDKRGQIAVLTDAGYATVVAAAPGHVGAVRANLFDALTPDQIDQLEAICAAVVARVGGSGGGPAIRADAVTITDADGVAGAERVTAAG